jgi:cytochrome c-type biogenesis protein CcmE
MTSYKQKRIIFVAIIFAISLAGLIITINNFSDNLIFFYKPNEIIDKPEIIQKIKNKNIRVGGLVKENSFKKIDALTIEFVITDYEKDLIIEHVGVIPDLFRDNQGVVANGIYDHQKNKFYSQELLIKHDENYMPPEIKNIKPTENEIINPTK